MFCSKIKNNKLTKAYNYKAVKQTHKIVFFDTCVIEVYSSQCNGGSNKNYSFDFKEDF